MAAGGTVAAADKRYRRLRQRKSSKDKEQLGSMEPSTV